MESTATTATFENFIKKQHTIIEESETSDTQDASNEEIKDDDLPLIEPIESILSSVSSMEDETQAVNVKSMVDAFELRGKEEMHGLSYRISGNSGSSSSAFQFIRRKGK